ncbi:MAG: Ig-like domain-containing protein [Deltaproteobacteria bacterium]|nr:Ig-like domain-containing protein [Deltaproteobacteria bacterium]
MKSRWIAFLSITCLLAACHVSEEDPLEKDQGPQPDVVTVDLQRDVAPSPDLPTPDLGVDQGVDVGIDFREIPKDLGPDKDRVPPQVASTGPADKATGVVLRRKLWATFTKAMDPATATPTSFLLKTHGVSIPPAKVTSSGDTAFFTPAFPFCPLTTYSATVTTAFTDLQKNALPADYTWSFTTADGAWDTPLVWTVAEPRVTGALAQNGDAFLAFTEAGHVKVATYSASVGIWSLRVQVDKATTTTAWSPIIAADAMGNALVAWQQGTSRDVYVARYDAKTHVWQQTPTSLETSTEKVLDGPMVAMSPTGQAMVVYLQNVTVSGTTTRTAFYNLYDGTTWSVRKAIPDGGDAPYQDIRVVSDGIGGFVVAWRARSTSSVSSLRSNVYDGVAKTWKMTSAVEVGKPVASWAPFSLAASPVGAAAAWAVHVKSGNERIYAARYDKSTWTTVVDISKNTSGYATNAQVAIGLTGKVYAAWNVGVTGGGVRLASFTAANGWGAVTSVTTDRGEGLSLALDIAGNGHLVWFDTKTGRLRGARLLAGVLGAPAWLSPARQGWAEGTTLSVNACGQGLFVAGYENEGPYSSPDVLLFH